MGQRRARPNGPSVQHDASEKKRHRDAVTPRRKEVRTQSILPCPYRHRHCPQFSPPRVPPTTPLPLLFQPAAVAAVTVAAVAAVDTATMATMATIAALVAAAAAATAAAPGVAVDGCRRGGATRVAWPPGPVSFLVSTGRAPATCPHVKGPAGGAGGPLPFLTRGGPTYLPAHKQDAFSTHLARRAASLSPRGPTEGIVRFHKRAEQTRLRIPPRQEGKKFQRA